MYDHLTEKTDTNMAKIKHIIGTEYPDIFGNVWVLHSCNDLGIPYFHKKGQKRLFTVSHCAHIENILEV